MQIWNYYYDHFLSTLLLDERVTCWRCYNWALISRNKVGVSTHYKSRPHQLPRKNRVLSRPICLQNSKAITASAQHTCRLRTD